MIFPAENYIQLGTDKAKSWTKYTLKLYQIQSGTKLSWQFYQMYYEIF